MNTIKNWNHQPLGWERGEIGWYKIDKIEGGGDDYDKELESPTTGMGEG